MDELLGCYVSASTNANLSKEEQELAFAKGREFRKYIWGNNALTSLFKDIKAELYGQDIKLILLEFYLNPLPQQSQYLENGFSYKRKEKAIGVPIRIDENFFNKNMNDRFKYLKNIICIKMESLKLFISAKNLDTRIDLIIEDLSIKWSNTSFKVE